MRHLSEEHKRRISESNKEIWTEERRKSVSGENNSCYGKHLSDEHRRKLSKAKKGYMPWIKGKHQTEEAKRKLSESNKGKHFSPKTEFKKGQISWNKGKHWSNETKKKISQSKKNPSIETRKKMSLAKIGKSPWMKGRHHSKESKRKLSETHKGKILSDEHKRKIKDKLQGHLVSEETRRKIGDKHRGKFVSQKTIRKISATKQCIPLSEWKEFIHFKPYTPDFNESFKDKIRKRDNNKCIICDKSEEELKRKLDIHHIDYNKLNSFPQNCISLCNSCHTKTGINRYQWITFFQSLLKERYSYQYTQNQKIILDF